MCRLQNIAMGDYQESVTTGQTDGRTKRFACAGMLSRRHNHPKRYKCTITPLPSYMYFANAAFEQLLL